MGIRDRDGFGIHVDVEESLVEDFQVTFEALSQAAMAAADNVSEWGKRALRADTGKALGPRVARTWRSNVYPRHKTSLRPAITWWSKAPHIVRAFSEGITIRSPNGFWLAIPTENAPKSGVSFTGSGRLKRAKKFAITEAERRYGKLRYVPIPGKKVALLVADKLRKRRGKRGGYTQASPTALRKGDFEDGIVIFVLVPQVKLPKSIDPESVADAIGREGVGRFAAAFEEITRRRFPAGARV